MISLQVKAIVMTGWCPQPGRWWWGQSWKSTGGWSIRLQGSTVAMGHGAAGHILSFQDHFQDECIRQLWHQSRSVGQVLFIHWITPEWKFVLSKLSINFQLIDDGAGDLAIFPFLRTNGRGTGSHYLAMSPSCWTISSSFIRAMFFFRFPLSCTWPLIY